MGTYSTASGFYSEANANFSFSHGDTNIVQLQAVNSAILGGSGITATEPNTLYSYKLNDMKINLLPATTATTFDFVVIDGNGSVIKNNNVYFTQAQVNFLLLSAVTYILSVTGVTS